MKLTSYLKSSFFKLLIFFEKINPFKKPAHKAEDLILENDPVYLIASGYEWTCPHCEQLNTEIEIPKQVVCPRCRRAYPVAEADHTWG